MQEFRYRAFNQEGSLVTGAITAETARDAVAALEAQGLHSVTAEPAPPAQHSPVTAPRMGWEDLTQFNDQLAAIVKAKLPLAPALAALSKDAASSRVRMAMEAIRSNVESGLSLSEACDRQPKAFSPVYRAMIRAGEVSGNLTGVLERLTDYSRRMAELRSQLIETLAYPVVLVVASFSLIMFILVKVMPVYVDVFITMGIGGAGMHRTGFGRIWTALAEFSDHNIEGIFIAFGVLLALFLYLCMPQPEGSRRPAWMDWLRLRLPGFGPLFLAQTRASFFRTLGMLLENRVMLPDALVLAGAASGTSMMESAAAQAALGVSEGRPLADAMQYPGAFDKTTCWLLTHGEEQGNLPATLYTISGYYDRFAESRGRWLLAMAGPIITVLIGLVVGFLFVGVYGPMIGFVV